MKNPSARPFVWTLLWSAAFLFSCKNSENDFEQLSGKFKSIPEFASNEVSKTELPAEITAAYFPHLSKYKVFPAGKVVREKYTALFYSYEEDTASNRLVLKTILRKEIRLIRLWWMAVM